MKKNKLLIFRIIAILIIFFILLTSRVYGVDENISVNVEYEFNEEDGKSEEGFIYRNCTINVKGEEIKGIEIIGYNSDIKTTEDLILPDSINDKIVIRIDDGAFGNINTSGAKAKFIGELKLPSQLKEIGKNAFASNYFSGELEIPTSVNKIESYAFANNDFIGELKIPEGIGGIEEGVFSSNKFSGELVILENVKYIGAYAFYDNEFNGELKIPEEIGRIEEGAFANNKFSGKLKIPKSVNIIERSAFANNSFSGKLEIPKSVNIIERSAFENNNFSGKLEIPKSVNKIESGAFANNKFSGKLEIPENVKYIGAYAFYDNEFNGELELPSQLTDIYHGTFGKNRFSSVKLNNIRYIGDRAFTNNNIEKINLPETLKKIENQSFANNQIETFIYRDGIEYGVGMLEDNPLKVDGIKFDENVTVFNTDILGYNRNNYIARIPKHIKKIEGGSSGDISLVVDSDLEINNPNSISEIELQEGGNLTINDDGSQKYYLIIYDYTSGYNINSDLSKIATIYTLEKKYSENKNVDERDIISEYNRTIYSGNPGLTVYKNQNIYIDTYAQIHESKKIRENFERSVDIEFRDYIPKGFELEEVFVIINGNKIDNDRIIKNEDGSLSITLLRNEYLRDRNEEILISMQGHFDLGDVEHEAIPLKSQLKFGDEVRKIEYKFDYIGDNEPYPERPGGDGGSSGGDDGSSGGDGSHITNYYEYWTNYYEYWTNYYSDRENSRDKVDTAKKTETKVEEKKIDTKKDDQVEKENDLIGNISKKAYVNGYQDGTFRPNDKISREEVAKLLYNALGNDYVSETKSNFTDVENTRWSRDAILFLEENDIISGYDDGSFMPEANITRAEMAAIVFRLGDLKESKELKETSISDISDHWAEKKINSVIEKGWIIGYPNVTFRPDDKITRAETVTLINKVIERSTQDTGKINNKFNDVNESDWFYKDVMNASSDI